MLSSFCCNGLIMACHYRLVMCFPLLRCETLAIWFQVCDLVAGGVFLLTPGGPFGVLTLPLNQNLCSVYSHCESSAYSFWCCLMHCLYRLIVCLMLIFYLRMASLLFAPGWHGCNSAVPVQVEQPVMLAPRCGFNWPPESMMKCAYSEPPFSTSLICFDVYDSYGSISLSKRINLHFTSHLLLQDPLLWSCDLSVAVSPMAVARFFEAASWIGKAFSMKWITYFHNMIVQFCERNIQLHVLSFFGCYVTHGNVYTVSENTWVSQPCIISKAII